MAIFTQIDISSDVEVIRDNFKRYILDRTDNFEEEIASIRNGENIKNLGDLSLEAWDDGVVYRNFVYILFGYNSKLDYRVCDAAFKYCIANDPIFYKFIKAVVFGTLECDLRKRYGRDLYGSQSRVFSEHWDIDLLKF